MLTAWRCFFLATPAKPLPAVEAAPSRFSRKFASNWVRISRLHGLRHAAASVTVNDDSPRDCEESTWDGAWRTVPFFGTISFQCMLNLALIFRNSVYVLNANGRSVLPYFIDIPLHVFNHALQILNARVDFLNN